MYEQSGRGGRDGGYVQAHNMDCLLPRLTWLWSLLSAQHVSSWGQHRALSMAPFHVVISQLPGGRLTTLNHFYRGMGNIFFLMEKTLWIWICFPCTQCFGQNSHLWNHRMPLAPSYFCIVSDQETTLIANGVHSKPMLMEFTSLTMIPMLLKQLSDWRVKWPFEDSFTIVASGNTLLRWRKFFQKTLYALNQYPIYGSVSLIARTHGCRNQGIEMGMASLTITSSDSLATFLLPVPLPYTLLA